MDNEILLTRVRIAKDELQIEAWFADGQKYAICTVEPEFADLAHWISAQINSGAYSLEIHSQIDRMKNDKK